MTQDSPKAPGPGGIILGWWSAHLGARETGAAKALAARLRRRSAIEILCEPAVHLLARDLRLTDAPRLVHLVRVLAELRRNDATRLARRLGGSDPVLSPARFQRLMRATGDDLTTGLIRAIHMLGPEARGCNIAQLGSDLFYWNDQTRARWAFDYFHQPTPDRLQVSETTT